jgi:hypothetical protein
VAGGSAAAIGGNSGARRAVEIAKEILAMTDRRDEFDGENGQTEDISPELHNSEQDDEQDQAQTLSGEMLGDIDSEEFGLDDADKVPTGQEGDDVPDLVDHMRQMVSSGLIDNSAYAGEPNDDDNEGMYLPAVDPDEESGPSEGE